MMSINGMISIRAFLCGMGDATRILNCYMEDRVADEGVLLSIATCFSAVWAWSMTSKLVAAVCNSNSKLDTREVKKLKGIKAKMAMPRPQAVAISASAIPPVTA